MPFELCKSLTGTVVKSDGKTLVVHTEFLSLAFNAGRATEDDKLTLYRTAIYGTSQPATPSTTPNLGTGEFAMTTILIRGCLASSQPILWPIPLQDLNLRSVSSVGVGYHVI